MNSSHDNTSVEYLLFDLGNVLVELNGFPWFEHQQSDLDTQEIHRRWVKLDSVKAFETGKLSEEDFFANIVVELGLQESPPSFSRRYQNWVKGFYPQAGAALRQLGKHYRLGCLSNTNSFHIRHLLHISTELRLFHDCFFSHEIGHIKPDKQAFLHVLDNVGIPPEKILFFDDNLDNVVSARQLGMQARHVIGFQSLCDTLSFLSLLKAENFDQA